MNRVTADVLQCPLIARSGYLVDVQATRGGVCRSAADSPPAVAQIMRQRGLLRAVMASARTHHRWVFSLAKRLPSPISRVFGEIHDGHGAGSEKSYDSDAQCARCRSAAVHPSATWCCGVLHCYRAFSQLDSVPRQRVELDDGRPTGHLERTVCLAVQVVASVCARTLGKRGTGKQHAR